jgi:hypothetical protein
MVKPEMMLSYIVTIIIDKRLVSNVATVVG